VAEAHHVVSGESRDQIAPELSRAADDDDAAQNTPPIRLRVSSISASRVIHWML
jgi:hypothetical protein